jgi:hypothetical protein
MLLVVSDQEGYPMTRVQFGWSLPSGPLAGMSRNAYMEGVQKGFELIKGHFDSFWFTDHLQADNNPLLEGWTVPTYFKGFRKLEMLLPCTEMIGRWVTACLTSGVSHTAPGDQPFSTAKWAVY